MDKYLCGLVTSDVFEYPWPPCAGRGFAINFKLVNLPGRSPLTKGTAATDNAGRTRFYPQKDLVIAASSLSHAQYVANLVYACLCIINGHAYFENPIAFPLDPKHCSEINRDLLLPARGTQSSTSHIPLAAMMAAKCSHRKERVYAVAKLLRSYRLYCKAPVDLDPQISNKD